MEEAPKPHLNTCPRCGEVDPPVFLGNDTSGNVEGCIMCPDSHYFVGMKCEDCGEHMMDPNLPMFCKARQH